MGSMHTGLEEHKEDPFAKMAHFFGERAKGCGLIVTGGIAPYFGEDAPQIVSGKCIGCKAGHSLPKFTTTLRLVNLGNEWPALDPIRLRCLFF